MDRLIEDALDAAALRTATPCERHPERKAVTSAPDARIGWRRRYMCKECADSEPKLGYARAFGTGLGPEAAAEADHWYVTFDAAGNRTFKERT